MNTNLRRENSRKPRLVDCFAGAGGLSLGFVTAGFEPVYAFDKDESSVKTYRRNIGKHIYLRNAYDISRAQIENDMGRPSGVIDVVAGGPPCQGFSVQRRGNDSDIRNHLVLEFLRIVLELKPKFFVMENVSGLLSKRGQSYMNEIKIQCDREGYYLHIQKLNAFEYGVPQVRKRVFIVGELMQDALLRFRFPNPSRGRIVSPATVRDAIGDLVDKDESWVPNHISDKLSPINIERIRSIKEGQGREYLPKHLQLDCHKNNSGHRHLDTYGRMAWDQPSPTITARFDSFSRGRFGHPEQDRSITLREGARLQSFPDSFVFEGNKGQVARQIGNAVPPLLALAIAEQLRTILREERYA